MSQATDFAATHFTSELPAEAVSAVSVYAFADGSVAVVSPIQVPNDDMLALLHAGIVSITEEPTEDSDFSPVVAEG